METIAPTLPRLFHGTRSARATAIRRAGFRRAKSASYTGTAVNLTESVCMAWEYGPDRGGKILEVTFAPGVRWENVPMGAGSDCDARFASGEVDALRTYGGNVWLLWKPEMVASIRPLPLKEIMTMAVAEWRKDGFMGYNGDMDDLATLFWKGEAGLRANMGIIAPSNFDKAAWRVEALARYARLLALAGVKPGDGLSENQ
jgi:hypothetical protein